MDKEELKDISDCCTMSKARLEILWSLLTHHEVLRLVKENPDIELWFDNKGLVQFKY